MKQSNTIQTSEFEYIENRYREKFLYPDHNVYESLVQSALDAIQRRARVKGSNRYSFVFSSSHESYIERLREFLHSVGYIISAVKIQFEGKEIVLTFKKDIKFQPETK